MARIIILVLLFAALAIGLIFLGTDRPTARELRTMHHEGVALIERHDFVAAEKILLQVVQFSPDAFVPRFNLAVAQLNQAEKGVGRALETLLVADALEPNHPKVAYAMGVIHEYVGRTGEALVAFRRAAELAPENADANYKLALAIYNSGDEDAAEQALPYFEITVRLDPSHVGAWNNLRGIYFSQGRMDDGNAAVEKLRALQDSGEGVALTSKYTEQGKLARAIRDWMLPERASNAALAIAFDPPLPLGEASPEIENRGIEDRAAAFVDVDLDCVPELWIAGAGGGIWELRDSAPTRHAAIDPLATAETFAVGDLDEDGVLDLVTATDGKILVHTLTGSPVPTFVRTHEIPLPDLGPIRTLRLVDLDMEGDLDLLILPETAAPVIALNEGRGLREPGDPTLPLEDAAGAELVAARSIDADVDADIVLSAGAAPHLRLVRNDPQWDFSVDPEGWAPAAALGAPMLSWIDDFDGDAIDDLLQVAPAGGAEAVRLGRGTGWSFGDPATVSIFSEAAVAAPGAVTDLVAADLDLDGDLDLVLVGGGALIVLGNDGNGSFDGVLRIATDASALLAADVDDDFDPDLVLLAPGGPVLLRNATNPLAHVARHHALRTYFGGERDGDDRRTNLLGIGVRIEARAESLRVGRTFEGAPGHRAQGLAPMIIGLGPREAAEWVYLVWPDGVSQAELEVATDACEKITEVQRKSSSCPVLFTWDGEGFRFITDFAGGGGLGFWIGPGEYAPPEPTEVVRIAPDALTPIEGELRLSVMEPMQESCVLDRLALAAVDHPVGTEVYPLEFFPVGGTPPSGAPLLVEEAARLFPTALTDSHGSLDPALLARVDRTYAGPRTLDPDLVGFAGAQEWVVTFDRSSENRAGSAPPTHLFLDGWVEYPYSRLNFAAWQRSEESTSSVRHRRLEAPSFWWDRGDGDWQLIGREIGYPAGMPKTMVLDVAEFVARGATRFRIASNLEIFWDRMFLAPAQELPAARSIALPLKRAVHRFGGYPREYSDDGALPLTYHYDERDPTLGYQPMGGMFTKYGRVDPLLESVDDQFVVMGGGDELILAWDATVLPAPAAGTLRTYLLDTHGYCKDRDPLTATPTSVEPLPFAAMTAYPPAPTDVEPERSEYRATWNTRRDGAEMPAWPRLVAEE